jgi:hypothetical protein
MKKLQITNKGKAALAGRVTATERLRSQKKKALLEYKKELQLADENLDAFLSQFNPHYMVLTDKNKQVLKKEVNRFVSWNLMCLVTIQKS